MTRVKVTVELDFPRNDAKAARELGRLMVEGRGFDVASVSVVKDPAAPKPFTPRSGAPGSYLTREGRAFQVWSEARGVDWPLLPYSSGWWVIPTDPRPGDAPVYFLPRSQHDAKTAGSTPLPAHANGTSCHRTCTCARALIRHGATS